MKRCKSCKWFKIPEELFCLSNIEIEEKISRIIKVNHHPRLQDEMGNIVQRVLNRNLNEREELLQKHKKNFPNFGECECPQIVCTIGGKPKKSEIALIECDDGYAGITFRVRGDFGCIAWEGK